MPGFGDARVAFAAFILAKLYQSSTNGNSRLGMVLDKGSLRVEEYMDRTIAQMREIIGASQTRNSSIFLPLLVTLRQWCSHPVSTISLSTQEPESNGAIPSTRNDERGRGSRAEHNVRRDSWRLMTVANETQQLWGEEQARHIDVSSQGLNDVHRSSREALREHIIGSQPTSQADNLQHFGHHDADGRAAGISHDSIAGDGSIPLAETSFVHHSDYPDMYSHPSVGFGGAPFPDGALMGFDFWPEPNLNADNSNIYGWPEDTNHR